jgi:hypothetical protein
MKFVAEVCGLKNVKVISPGGVPVGEAIKLECQFDTEDDQLYAVKWYKGKKEFYRYVPRDNPPGKVFSSSGVNVNVSRVRFRVYTPQQNTNTLLSLPECMRTLPNPTPECSRCGFHFALSMA